MAPKRTINPIEIKPKPKKVRRSRAKKPKLSIKNKISLEDAIKNGNLEIVKQFLKLDFDLDERNEKGMTILHLACYHGHSEIVEEILGKGVNIDLYICCRQILECDKDHSGITALILAITYEHKEVVKLLLEHGADMTYHIDSYNAFQAAYEHNEEFTILDILLAHAVKANISVRDLDLEGWNNNTCLHSASSSGQTDLVKVLLKYDFDIDAKNDHGKTALHLASNNGHSEIVKELLDHGANVNAQNNDGDSPLHKAVKHCASIGGEDENIILQTILEGTNVDFYLKNNEGKTALQVAIDKKDTNTARMLAKKMAPKSSITHSIYPLHCFLR